MKRLVTFCLLLIALGLGASVAKAANPDVLFDLAVLTGQPLTNVLVTIEPLLPTTQSNRAIIRITYTNRTDYAGRFWVSNMVPNSYRSTVSHRTIDDPWTNNIPDLAGAIWEGDYRGVSLNPSNSLAYSIAQQNALFLLKTSGAGLSNIFTRPRLVESTNRTTNAIGQIWTAIGTNGAGAWSNAPAAGGSGDVTTAQLIDSSNAAIAIARQAPGLNGQLLFNNAGQISNLVSAPSFPNGALIGTSFREVLTNYTVFTNTAEQSLNQDSAGTIVNHFTKVNAEGKLHRSTNTASDMQTWSAASPVLTNIYFACIKKFPDAWYGLGLTNYLNAGSSNLFLIKSPDGITWALDNGGNAVVTNFPGSYYHQILNPAFDIGTNGLVYLALESLSQSGSTTSMSSASAPWANKDSGTLRFVLPTHATFGGADPLANNWAGLTGNPDVHFIPERASVMVFAGGLIIGKPTKTVLGVWKYALTNNIQYGTSWVASAAWELRSRDTNSTDTWPVSDGTVLWVTNKAYTVIAHTLFDQTQGRPWFANVAKVDFFDRAFAHQETVANGNHLYRTGEKFELREPRFISQHWAPVFGNTNAIRDEIGEEPDSANTTRPRWYAPSGVYDEYWLVSGTAAKGSVRKERDADNNFRFSIVDSVAGDRDIFAVSVKYGTFLNFANVATAVDSSVMPNGSYAFSMTEGSDRIALTFREGVVAPGTIHINYISAGGHIALTNAPALFNLSAIAAPGLTNDPFMVRNANGEALLRVDTNGVLTAAVKTSFGSADPILQTGSGGNGFRLMHGFGSAFRNFGIQRPDGSPMLALDLTALEIQGSLTVGSSFGGLDNMFSRFGVNTNAFGTTAGNGSIVASNAVFNGLIHLKNRSSSMPTAAAIGANNGVIIVSNAVLFYFSTTDGSTLTTAKLSP